MLGKSLDTVDECLFSGYKDEHRSLERAYNIRTAEVEGVINSVVDLSELTDSYLERMIGFAIFEPIVLEYDQARYELRVVGSQTVGVVCIPFKGNEDLFRFYAGHPIPYPIPHREFAKGTIRSEELRFDVSSTTDSAKLKCEIDDRLMRIRSNLETTNTAVEKFNLVVRTKLRKAFDSRKEHLMDIDAAFKSIGLSKK